MDLMLIRSDTIASGRYSAIRAARLSWAAKHFRVSLWSGELVDGDQHKIVEIPYSTAYTLTPELAGRGRVLSASQGSCRAAREHPESFRRDGRRAESNFHPSPGRRPYCGNTSHLFSCASACFQRMPVIG
jgi:hypothetical protein